MIENIKVGCDANKMELMRSLTLKTALVRMKYAPVSVKFSKNSVFRGWFCEPVKTEASSFFTTSTLCNVLLPTTINGRFYLNAATIIERSKERSIVCAADLRNVIFRTKSGCFLVILSKTWSGSPAGNPLLRIAVRGWSTETLRNR